MVQTVKKTMNENLPFLKDSKYLSASAWNTKCLWSKVLEELVVLKLFSMLLASILLPLIFWTSCGDQHEQKYSSSVAASVSKRTFPKTLNYVFWDES